MNKVYSTGLFFIFSLYIHIQSIAQTPAIQRCCGSTPSNYPFNTLGGQRTQLWYNPGNFTGTSSNGMIDRLYFRSTTAAQSATYINLKISLSQPSSGTGFAGTSFVTGMTEVLNEPSYNIAGGNSQGAWFPIPLTTAFAFDPLKPLIVDVTHSGKSGTGIETYSSQAPQAPTQKLYAASATATGGAPSNNTWQDIGLHLFFPPCPAPPLLGRTYTIDKYAPTNGTNFQSFNAAIASMQCGITGPVIFNVIPASGPYYERVTIPQVPGASPVSTVTFNGNGESITYSFGTLQDRSAIVLDGADHIIIDSLLLNVGGGAYGIGIQLNDHADSNIIRNCTIITNNTSTGPNQHMGLLMDAVGTRSPAYNTIINNSIFGGYYSIRMQGNTANDTANYQNSNRIINNKLMDSYAAAISLSGVKRAVIAGNDISRPTRTNIGSTWNGVDALASWGLMIENNRIHNVFDATPLPVNNTFRGFYMYTSSYNWSMPSTLRNNIIYNIRSNNSVSGIYIIGSYYDVYHNTIILNDTATQSSGNMAAFGQLNSGESNIRNNIFYLKRNGPASKLVYSFTGSFTATPVINNNIVYMNGSGGSTNIGSYKSINYTTWNEWRSAMGNAFDQHSVNIDPQFVSERIPIPLALAAQDTGAAVSVMTDINGNTRSVVKPDPGAFENLAVYVFSGSGDWNNPANWVGSAVPPNPVPAHHHVLINPVPGGSCTYNGNLTFSKGAVLKVPEGVAFIVNGNISFLDKLVKNSW